MQLKALVFPCMLNGAFGANSLATRRSTASFNSLSILSRVPSVSPLEIKTHMGPLLVGLDTAHYEARRHQYAIHLYALYQAEELPHLIHISTAWLL